MNFWSVDNYVNMFVLKFSKKNLGFPGSSTDKESTCNAGDPGSVTGFERRRRAWQPTPVFLPEFPMDRGAWATGYAATGHGLQFMGSQNFRHD